MIEYCFSKKVRELLFFAFLILGLSLKAQENRSITVPFDNETVRIRRLNNTAMLLQVEELQILINPKGKLPKTFTGDTLDLIVITDASKNSFELSTLQQLNTQNAKIFVPWALGQKLPLEFTTQLDPLKHLDDKERFGLVVTAYYEANEMRGYILNSKNHILFIGSDGSKTFLPEGIQKIDLAIVSGIGMNSLPKKSNKVTEVTYLFPYNFKENRAQFLNIWKKAQPSAKIFIE